MLVISRRAEETFVFPALDVTVKVLKVKGGVAKVGIQAPRELEILRGEVVAQAGSFGSLSQIPAVASERHALRNRLNAAKLAAHLARRQIGLGDLNTAEATLEQMLGTFQEAEQMMEAMRPATHTALLVDDDDNERELLAAYLKSFGYKVETVSDGIAALEYLQDNESPDVVLLDMCMPRCDGPNTIRHIRETPSLNGIRVFAVSGSDPKEVGVHVGAGGVNAWFEKPLNPEQLIRHLRSETTSAQVSV